ncbi:MAG: hypothetical protein H6698_09185 [Myxococcales bacterium]|nr:hypothetical protein [Myxococcales bacterium]MCB9534460.1 hypothetical protein [Myxococcales bacterium]
MAHRDGGRRGHAAGDGVVQPSARIGKGFLHRRCGGAFFFAGRPVAQIRGGPELASVADRTPLWR